MPSLDPTALSERFIRASGPGGQNVNKVATAVQLRFDLAKASLPDAVKARLRALAGSRLTTDDVVVIDAHEHRTQAKNREAARARLAEMVKRAERKPKKRKPTKPGALAREKRLVSKHKRGEIKKARTKRASED